MLMRETWLPFKRLLLSTSKGRGGQGNIVELTVGFVLTLEL